MTGTGKTRSRGFTLAEVLVASTISGFIAIVAVGALNALATSSQKVNRASATSAEIRFAARMLARDLANFYRDPNPENMKLIGVSQTSETGGPPFLTFYVVGRSKARAGQPEGEVYEVEYFLGTRPGEEDDVAASPEEEASILFRRLWPNPDKEREPRGILAPIAENIGIFEIRFWDGQQWVNQWTEEMRSLPQLMEITLATLPPDKGDPVVETLTVTFPRLSQAAAAAAQAGEASGSPQGQQDQQGQQQSGSQSTTQSSTQSTSSQGGGQGNSGGGRP